MKDQQTRICIASSFHISERVGGVEWQTYFLAKALRESGFRVIFLCPTLRNKVPDPTQDLFYYPHGASAWNIPEKQIAEHLQAIRPSIIYLRGKSSLQENGIIQKYAKKHAIPLVFGVSSDSDIQKHYRLQKLWTGPKRWPFKILLTPYALWSDHRMKETLKSAELLIFQHTDQKKKCRLNTASAIIPSMHFPVRGAIRKSPANLVVWIANYRDGKNGELFLDLAKESATLECQFHMVLGNGRGEKVQAISRKSRDIPNLTIANDLSAQEIESLLEKAILLVNTSDKQLEGFPNIFIQAWLRETVTVSLFTDPGGIITKHKLGKCSSATSLFQDVRYLVNHPEQRKTMGKNARKYAEHQHGYERNFRIAGHLFEKLLHHDKHPDPVQGQNQTSCSPYPAENLQ